MERKKKKEETTYILKNNLQSLISNYCEQINAISLITILFIYLFIYLFIHAVWLNGRQFHLRKS
jgi:hypothetical protein